MKNIKQDRLRNFPISFFSIILGLSGFSIATQKVADVLNISISIGDLVVYFTTIIFIAISLIYLFKMILFPKSIKEEFQNPVKLAFFPTFSISLILLSIAYLPISNSFSKVLWIVGLVLHLIFTMKILSIWIQDQKFNPRHINPAWFIPVVGNILVPIAGVVHANSEISWFFYSIGIIFWIILLVIFFYRIIFIAELPEKLLPTLFILISPPAIGFISYVKLTGTNTPFSKILYYFALFTTILLISQFNLFRRIKFYLSWWAYSFPIASMMIASVLMLHKTQFEFFKILTLILYAGLIILVIFLLIRTVICIARGNICVIEKE